MSGDFVERINFVIPKALEWPELRDDTFASMSQEQLAQRSLSGHDNWVILPYQYFKKNGLNVTHSEAPRVGFLNVAGGFYLGAKERGVSPFVVVCQADAHPSRIANFIVLQNGCRKGMRWSAAMSHPLQPGLVPRNPNRSGLRVLVYKGRTQNLDRSFQDREFRRRLLDFGVEFRIDDQTDEEDETGQLWRDYSDVDAVLAVRNLTYEDALGKPANKLVNAWRAGVPAILGPEPAYQELRRSTLDYLEVRSADEAVTAIKSLRENPDLYNAVIANGFSRAADYSDEKIFGMWLDAFNGPILSAYNDWIRRSYFSKTVRFFLTAIDERISKRAARRYRRSGPRLLE